MKNILFTINFLLINTLVSFGNSDAAFFEDTKTIVKAFKVSKDAELEIVNKHGQVTFETWEKDSVRIEVTIQVTSDRLEQIQSLLGAVDVRVTNTLDYITASTVWNSSTGIRMDVTKLLGGQKINVSYKVFLPKNIELSVDNKFGDIVMDDFDGKLKVAIAHGKFMARSLPNLRKLDAMYSKVDIKSCNDVDFNVRFSSLKIKQAQKIAVDAVSSDLKIGFAASGNFKVVSGSIEIDVIDSFTLTSSMCSIEIERLNKNLTGDIKFGSLQVDEITSNFASLSLAAQNTDVKLDFQSNVGYAYTVELEKGKLFKVPTEGNTLESETSLGEVKQYIGTFKNGLASVKIKAKSSYITFDVAD